MTPRDPFTEQVIGAASEVHRILGPGLLESVYEKCLCHELRLRGMEFERQVLNFNVKLLRDGIKRLIL
jgi:GxxExxY protein